MRKFIFVFIALFVLVSCSSKAPKKAENPVDLYVAGVNLMNTKKYDKAVEKFKAITGADPVVMLAHAESLGIGSRNYQVLIAGR